MKRSSIVALCLALMCCQHHKGEVQASTVQENHPIEVTQATVVLTDFTQVAAKSIDAVVHIKTEMTRMTPLYETFFGMIIDHGMQRQRYEAFGSGVIISSDGYIITNNHVVQDAETVTVTLNDKRSLPATIVGLDAASDLAVIKIEADSLTFLTFGNSDLTQIGEPVLAIGNPFNLTSTVTAGIISAKARDINIITNPTSVEPPIESFLQTDAAVNSGNSGGALVNARGELIGIIAAIASGNGYYTGYSFAIPANIAVKVQNDLRLYHTVQRGYLGVNVAEMSSKLASRKGLDQLKGVYIGRVLQGCAAEKAGLKVGDVILKVNNMECNSYAQMMEEVARFSPGDTVMVTYQRDNMQATVPLVLLNSKGNTDIVRH